MRLPIKKKQLLLLGFGIGILTVTAIGLKLFVFPAPPKSVLTDKQKSQALEKILGRSVNTGQSQEVVENLTRHTSIADYSYPANAQILEDTVKSSADSFSYSLPIKHVVISVQTNHNLDVKKLDEVSGYRIRTLDSKMYKPFPISIDSVTGQGFEKDDETAQKVAFIFYKGWVLSFSVTGYNLDRVDQFFNPLLSSVVLH